MPTLTNYEYREVRRTLQRIADRWTLDRAVNTQKSRYEWRDVLIRFLLHNQVSVCFAMTFRHSCHSLLIVDAQASTVAYAATKKKVVYNRRQSTALGREADRELASLCNDKEYQFSVWAVSSVRVAPFPFKLNTVACSSTDSLKIDTSLGPEE